MPQSNSPNPQQALDKCKVPADNRSSAAPQPAIAVTRSPHNLALFECPGMNSTLSHLCFTPFPMPGAKQAIPLPGREQQVGGLVGLIPSVKQSRCRRSPAFRQQGGSRCSRFHNQVSEYFVDHRRIFSAIAPGIALPPTYMDPLRLAR